MVGFVLRRLLTAIPTIFIVITLSFFMMRIAPGGPFDLERALPQQILDNLNKVYKLNEPLYVQYLAFLNNLLHGDLGPSFINKDFTVAQLFAHGLPVSVQIGLSALVLALIVGVTLGSFAALRQNTLIDYGVIGLATFGVTVPTFVTAPVLTFIFALGFQAMGWWHLPAGGWDDGALANRVLPTVTLALPQIAIIARLTRASLIEALRANHIRTLRALGLPGRTVTFHALRGALLPVVSYLGPAAASLLTGSVVIEKIFGIPGMGRHFVEGALSRDYTVVMGTVILIAVFIILFNMIVDILYVVLDPRVRAD